MRCTSIRSGTGTSPADGWHGAEDIEIPRRRHGGKDPLGLYIDAGYREVDGEVRAHGLERLRFVDKGLVLDDTEREILNPSVFVRPSPDDAIGVRVGKWAQVLVVNYFFFGA